MKGTRYSISSTMNILRIPARATVAFNRVPIRGGLLAQCTSSSQSRGIHSTSNVGAEEAASTTTSATIPVVPTLSKEQLKKRELRRLSQRKTEAKRPASIHPLYMPVVEALRYIRAAEVGRPSGQQTITLTSLVVNEKGVAPLNGHISLPRPLKALKVAVFSQNEELLTRMKEKYHCHLVGGVELINKIKNGEVKTDFDKAFASSDMANILSAQLGKTLGRRGLLPNAKKGTVSDDLESLLADKIGSLPFRQTGNCISIGIGKCHFSDEEILRNIIAARSAVMKALSEQKSKKPSILGKTTLSSTCLLYTSRCV